MVDSTVHPQFEALRIITRNFKTAPHRTGR
jgi:hypothetical protein